MISLVICAKYVSFETFFSWEIRLNFQIHKNFFNQEIFLTVCSCLQVRVQLVESFFSLNSYLILCRDVFAIVELDALLSNIFCRNVYKYFCSALRKKKLLDEVLVPISFQVNC